jgi:hypothetical protein
MLTMFKNTYLSQKLKPGKGGDRSIFLLAEAQSFDLILFNSNNFLKVRMIGYAVEEPALEFRQRR